MRRLLGSFIGLLIEDTPEWVIGLLLVVLLCLFAWFSYLVVSELCSSTKVERMQYPRKSFIKSAP